MRGLLLVFLPILLFAQSQLPSTTARDGANLPVWIIALCAFALTALAGAQFWSIHRQAQYMRDGLLDTKRASEAAKSASAMAKMALETFIRGNVGIESVLRDTLAENKKSANAAASASATARMALEASARANVGIESILLVDPSPSGSRRTESRAARSRVQVIIKNFGATPAREMDFEFRVTMPPYIEQPVSFAGSGAELHTFCSARSAFKPIQEMCSEFFSDADVNMFLCDLRVDGHVRYKDVFGNRYYVGCAAAFNAACCQFDIVTTVRSDPENPPDAASLIYDPSAVESEWSEDETSIES